MEDMGKGMDTLIKGLEELKPEGLKDNDDDLYKCKVCKDTGYYTIEVEGIYEGFVDKAMQECSCLAEIRSNKYLKKSGLDRFADKTVNDFNVNFPHQKTMKEFATEYVMKDSRSWFVMLGATGSGKSHLCASVTKTLIGKGLEARYVVWDDFMNELNAMMYEDDNRRALDTYKMIPVLFIDDFFKGRITDHTKKIAFDLINYRVNNEKTTIISSEFMLSDIAEVDEAIASRIARSAEDGYYVLEIPKGKNTNYRLANSKTRVAV